MRELATKTQEIYERNAQAFCRQRNKSLFEKPWIDRFLSLIPRGGTILDVGCGTGEPIATYMIEQQYKIVGVDFSKNMLAIAGNKHPEQTWIYMDMRMLELKNQYEGLISWGAFFHLTPCEQHNTLVRFVQHLLPKGVLLLTVGHERGEVIGTVHGEPVYHSSLSIDEYKEILQQHQCQLLDFVPQDPQCQEHSILLAQKLS